MKYYVAKQQDTTPKIPLQTYQLKSFPLSEKPEVNSSTFLGRFTKGPTKDSESHFYVSRTLAIFCVFCFSRFLTYNSFLPGGGASENCLARGRLGGRWKGHVVPLLFCVLLVQTAARCCFRCIASTNLRREKPSRFLLFHTRRVLLGVCLSLDGDLPSSADGEHPATKRQSSDCCCIHPRQSLRPQRQMKSCPSSIGAFVSPRSSFVLQGHQIQSAECSSFRGAEQIAFILLCL